MRPQTMCTSRIWLHPHVHHTVDSSLLCKPCRPNTLNFCVSMCERERKMFSLSVYAEGCKHIRPWKKNNIGLFSCDLCFIGKRPVRCCSGKSTGTSLAAAGYWPWMHSVGSFCKKNRGCVTLWHRGWSKKLKFYISANASRTCKISLLPKTKYWYAWRSWKDNGLMSHRMFVLETLVWNHSF